MPPSPYLVRTAKEEVAGGGPVDPVRVRPESHRILVDNEGRSELRVEETRLLMVDHILHICPRRRKRILRDDKTQWSVRPPRVFEQNWELATRDRQRLPT